MSRATSTRSRSTVPLRVQNATFLGPAVLIVGVLLLVPFVLTTYQSLTADNGLEPATFIGFDNYAALMRDAGFLHSLLNTVLWTAGAVLLPASVGLAIATFTRPLRFGRIFQLVFIVPYALSGVATGTIWSFLLSTEGSINAILGEMGLGELARGWLLTWPTNTLVMIGVYVWQVSGVAVILYLVGLDSVPRETVEAGQLDGARGASLFWHIIFPQLRAITVVVVGISLTNGLRVFDLIWVLTGGGPGQVSEALAVTMYRRTFVLGDYGVGSAVAVILTVIVVITSWIYLRAQMPRRRQA
ncbi:carbohydrate ABC transporter permease [Ruania alba]|uniref:Multiple sugar transport system permease protein n=1 Tax=Ruania alba TaxID=648782 RepID=A0A1H5NCS4_9MICO|nr:sugar ABC transporter permease [Ruania alba]SEE99304.1 multiple sugar transport system permease protein [Ruania alba]